MQAPEAPSHEGVHGQSVATSEPPATGATAAQPPYLTARRIILPGLRAQAFAVTFDRSGFVYAGGARDDGLGRLHATVWRADGTGAVHPEELPMPPGAQQSGVGTLAAAGGRVLAAAGGGDPGVWLRSPSGRWSLLTVPGVATLHLVVADGMGWVGLGFNAAGQAVFARIQASGSETRVALGLTGPAAAPSALVRLGPRRWLATGGAPGFAAVSSDDGGHWLVSHQLAQQAESLAAVLDGQACAVSDGRTRNPADRAQVSSDGLHWARTGGVGAADFGVVDEVVGGDGSAFAFGATRSETVAVWASHDCRTWVRSEPQPAITRTEPVYGAAAGDKLALVVRQGTGPTELIVLEQQRRN